MGGITAGAGKFGLYLFFLTFFGDFFFLGLETFYCKE